jgi:hypothetical protein
LRSARIVAIDVGALATPSRMQSREHLLVRIGWKHTIEPAFEASGEMSSSFHRKQALAFSSHLTTVL